jgi:ribulose-5-phosphate 4-epimerase/fuculose-1-phosphate aldolase
VRHLGRGVGRLGPTRLAGGDNAFVTLDHRVLCLGMTLDRLVFNAELLEKCAKAFVLAHSSGARLTRVPWFVRAIAGRRLRRDQRFAAQCHGLGKPPVFKSAY